MSADESPGMDNDLLIEMLLSGQTVEEASFEITRSEKFSVLTLNKSPDQCGVSMLEPGDACLFRPQDRLIVIRLQSIEPLSAAGASVLQEFRSKIEANGKALRFLSLARFPEIPTELHAPNLQEALISVGLTHAQEVNPDFVRVFTEKSIEAIKVQLHTDVSAEPPSQRTLGQEFEGYTGMLEFVGPSIRGMLAYTLNPASLLRLMSRMLKKECTEVDETVASGACELPNIVMGLAKTQLNAIGYGISATALPVLVVPDFQGFFAAGDDSTGAIVPLTFDGGQILLELRFFLEN